MADNTRRIYQLNKLLNRNISHASGEPFLHPPSVAVVKRNVPHLVCRPVTELARELVVHVG